jgi:hypothetical protein
LPATSASAHTGIAAVPPAAEHPARFSTKIVSASVAQRPPSQTPGFGDFAAHSASAVHGAQVRACTLQIGVAAFVQLAEVRH